MAEAEAYDEVYALFTALADRSQELTDEQHLCVMDAFNDFVAAGDPHMPAPVRIAEKTSVRELLSRTADGLACLVDATADGATALHYARVHALMIASLAA